MFKRKHMAMIVLLLSVFLTMAGCSKKSDTYSTEYKDGYMRIFHDGKIFATYLEEFDEDVYSEDKLKDMVDKEIAEFNENYSKDNGMYLEKFEIKDDEAMVRLAFDTVEDYILYNEKYVNSNKVIKMFIGTYDEAVAAGYKVTGKLKVAGKKEKIDVDELKEKEDISDLYVVYTNEGTVMRFDGDIKYVNKNVKLDEKMAITSDKSQNFILYSFKEK
ncbi:MAG: hypothetical protein HDT39_15360 [Lachnospiraceae bacterium]|nr:hypothetical protein [Lachnospiraceae bacterium]